MTGMTVAKNKPKPKPTDPQPGDTPSAPDSGSANRDDEVITTVKAYRRFAKKLAQLCSLLDINQQDGLARYERYLEDDLLTLLAKRQAEIRESQDRK